jgi:hypothetical protein
MDMYVELFARRLIILTNNETISMDGRRTVQTVETRE